MEPMIIRSWVLDHSPETHPGPYPPKVPEQATSQGLNTHEKDACRAVSSQADENVGDVLVAKASG